MLHSGARILGIDLGSKWVGLAIADWDVRIATAYDVIEFGGRKQLIERLKPIIESENIALIVMGLPLNMNGSEGIKAREAKNIGDLIKESLPVELEYMDESLTTSSAIGELHLAGGKVGKSRKKINMIAAAIMLQDYLNSLRA